MTVKTRKQGNSVTITIPSRFKIQPGIEFEPEKTNEGILFRFTKDENYVDFTPLILRDLVNEGYEGYNLIEEYQKRKDHIPIALQMLRDEAKAKGPVTREEFEKIIGL
jgi:antitoxin component of MazEF toxin-antitoxin module